MAPETEQQSYRSGKLILPDKITAPYLGVIASITGGKLIPMGQLRIVDFDAQKASFKFPLNADKDKQPQLELPDCSTIKVDAVIVAEFGPTQVIFINQKDSKDGLPDVLTKVTITRGQQNLDIEKTEIGGGKPISPSDQKLLDAIASGKSAIGNKLPQ